MPGELNEIGRRPRLVASFAGPGAPQRFDAWRHEQADLLATVPIDAMRVEYGGAGRNRWIRVRVEESHIPAGLDGPDEAGAADGLPPGPPTAAR